MLIQRVPWKRQPYGAVPSKLLGLTALILPGQSSQDIVSGVELGTVIGTPTRTVNGQGPALQHNANREAIYTSATAAQKSPQGSIVWAGTLTGTPTTAACLGGTTFDASNTSPFVGLEVKRRVAGGFDSLAISYSYGSSTGNVENLVGTGTYTTGDVVVVGTFESGRQILVIKSATGIETASGTRVGSLSYGSTARIEVGESLNNRNPAAESALLALSNQAWSLSTAMQVANDVWGQLFQPRSIWVPVSAGGGSVSGTSATTNANDTSAASGATTVVGTSATTNAADTSAASGSVGGAVTGTSATTNANDTGAASGTTTVAGTVAYSNANDSAAASGWAGAVSGTAAVTNGDDASAATGTAGTVQVFFGGGYPMPRRRTKKELDDERRRLGILPPEVVDEVAAAPVARRRITLQDLIGKKAAAEITNVDLSQAIAASKKRKRQRDDELLLLM